MPPIDPPTTDLAALTLREAADVMESLAPEIEDLSKSLQALALRAEAGEKLPRVSVEQLLRKWADILSDRSGRLHDAARVFSR